VVALRRPRIPLWAAAWLVIGALYFLVPLLATVKFSLEGAAHGYSLVAYRTVLRDQQFRSTLWLSFKLAIETTVISLVLMIPTVYWVHLKVPRLRALVSFICILPFVVPPIVLIVGLLAVYGTHAPQWFIATPRILVAAYVILSLPFVYFSLDAGLRAIDVHTLTEASQSLGASWHTTMLRVILPNIRAAALSAAFLTVAVVMGEYTMASLLLFNTFPVYIAYIGQTTAYPAAALSVLSFAITWLAMLMILLVGRRRGGGASVAESAATVVPAGTGAQVAADSA
jgi:putative spermidine/putrescine transport system permease protein